MSSLVTRLQHAEVAIQKVSKPSTDSTAGRHSSNVAEGRKFDATPCERISDTTDNDASTLLDSISISTKENTSPTVSPTISPGNSILNILTLTPSSLTLTGILRSAELFIEHQPPEIAALLLEMEGIRDGIYGYALEIESMEEYEVLDQTVKDVLGRMGLRYNLMMGDLVIMKVDAEGRYLEKDIGKNRWSSRH
jgi:hypothetical protein